MASKPCPVHGCHHLKPCETHPERPRNAPWSKGRDRAAQADFRRRVLTRDGHRCTRCSSTTDLVAHHVRPGYTTDAGITLCQACHKELDADAR